MKKLLICTSIALSALSTGCASITKGNDQSLTIDTIGCSSDSAINCTIDNKDNHLVTAAPGTVTVEKGRKDLLVHCVSEDGLAEGTATVASRYEAMNAGNLLLGGVIGAGVDAATGAMWQFDKQVTVPLKCTGAAAR